VGVAAAVVLGGGGAGDAGWLAVVAAAELEGADEVLPVDDVAADVAGVLDRAGLGWALGPGSRASSCSPRTTARTRTMAPPTTASPSRDRWPPAPSPELPGCAGGEGGDGCEGGGPAPGEDVVAVGPASCVEEPSTWVVAAAAATGSCSSTVAGGPAYTARSSLATSSMAGRSSGAAASILSRAGVSSPLCVGGVTRPDATWCSNAIGFSWVPKGGTPSTAAYSVAARENTSEAKVDSEPRATSGAR